MGNSIVKKCAIVRLESFGETKVSHRCSSESCRNWPAAGELEHGESE